MSGNRYTLPSIGVLKLNPKKGNRTKNSDILFHDSNLEETKNKISLLSHSQWIKSRKLANPYEFPYSSKKLDSKPISRAFFKFLEIVKDNNIVIDSNTLHLAEAPGGFIEGTIYYKARKYNTLHYTFSIIGNRKTPVYHTKLVKNKDVIILSNNLNKGDLYDVNNIKYLVNLLKNKGIGFITCDGGFAENNEFTEKEQLHHKLIFNQMVCSILILEEGGTFVLKIFDIFTELTFDIIYVLSYLFQNVYIHKPFTSRSTNSEKYIVCKNFIQSRLSIQIENMFKVLCNEGIEHYKSFIDKEDLNEEFLEKIRSINTELADSQIDSINMILNNNDYLNCEEKKKIWEDRYYDKGI